MAPRSNMDIINAAREGVELAMSTRAHLLNREISNPLTGKENREDVFKELSEQIKEVNRLGNLSPMSRLAEKRYDPASTEYSPLSGAGGLFQEQYLKHKGKESLGQLSNQEFGEFENSFKKLLEAIKNGSKDVQVLADQYSGTMAGAARATQQANEAEKEKARTLSTLSKGIGGLYSGGMQLSNGLEQGNWVNAGMGAMGIGMAARGLAPILGGVGAGAAAYAAGDLATTYAQTQIAEPRLIAAANTALSASQARGAVGANIDLMGAKTLELQSGMTVGADQFNQSLMYAGARTSLSGGRESSLTASLSQYGAAGIGAESFNNAVDKFSKIADHSNLTKLVESIPEIAGRGNGAVTPETVQGLTQLTYQLRYGRGVDKEGENTTRDTAIGIRGSMEYLNSIGVKGSANQLNTLTGAAEGLQNLGSTNQGMGLLYSLTGSMAVAMDPSLAIKSPKYMKMIKEGMAKNTSMFEGMGVDEEGNSVAEAMQKRVFTEKLGSAWSQMILTNNPGGAADISTPGISTKERADKAKEGGGTAFDVKMNKAANELNLLFKSLPEDIGNSVKGLQNMQNALQAITLTAPTASAKVLAMYGVKQP